MFRAPAAAAASPHHRSSLLYRCLGSHSHHHKIPSTAGTWHCNVSSSSSCCSPLTDYNYRFYSSQLGKQNQNNNNNKNLDPSTFNNNNNINTSSDADFLKSHQPINNDNSSSSMPPPSPTRWFKWILLGLTTGIIVSNPHMREMMEMKLREVTGAIGGAAAANKDLEKNRLNKDEMNQLRQILDKSSPQDAAANHISPRIREERALQTLDHSNSANHASSSSVSAPLVEKKASHRDLAAEHKPVQEKKSEKTAASNTTEKTLTQQQPANNSSEPINHSYHNLLEKKQHLLEELETELSHLRSFLLQTEQLTSKRERQFDELQAELSHVRSYLINKESQFHLKDQEIQSLENSLSNAQRKMDSAIGQIREEHKQKIHQLEQLHKAELEEVESSIDSMLEDQKKILEQEYLKQNQERIEQLRQLTEKVYAVEESFHRSSSYLINSVRLQKLTAATLALQQVLKTDAPFSPEMKVLSEEGYGDRLIEEMVYAIPKEVQREGIPCRHDLYREFCNIDRKVLEASYIPVSAGFFGLLYSKIVGKFLIQERGLVDGHTVDAKLARARVYLANDKLSLAISELNAINGEAREVLQPWLMQAQYRLIADQSIDILHAHITNLSSSLVQ